MAYKFEIKGEIVTESDGWYGFYSRDDLKEQLQSAGGDDLFIDIDSIGGCVHTGLAMFADLRRYVEENNATITTRSSGFVASIATAIFLAGDTRIVNEFMQPFIHEPFYWWTDDQNADDFKKSYEELEQTKNLLADFYAKNTELTKEEALEFMANDTWISAEECKRIGFATEIEELSRNKAKLVAKIKSRKTNKHNKQQTMSKNTESWITRLANVMARKSAKAELELAGVDDKVIKFPDLEAGATPTVGDKVVIDEDANYTGKAETERYIFGIEDGVLAALFDKTEIDTEEVVEELLEIIEDLEEEVKEATAKYDNLAKLYNQIGGKGSNPKSGKETKKDKVDDGLTKAQAAIEKRKNRKTEK